MKKIKLLTVFVAGAFTVQSAAHAQWGSGMSGGLQPCPTGPTQKRLPEGVQSVDDDIDAARLDMKELKENISHLKRSIKDNEKLRDLELKNLDILHPELKSALVDYMMQGGVKTNFTLPRAQQDCRSPQALKDSYCQRRGGTTPAPAVPVVTQAPVLDNSKALEEKQSELSSAKKHQADADKAVNAAEEALKKETVKGKKANPAKIRQLTAQLQDKRQLAQYASRDVTDIESAIQEIRKISTPALAAPSAPNVVSTANTIAEGGANGADPDLKRAKGFFDSLVGEAEGKVNGNTICGPGGGTGSAGYFEHFKDDFKDSKSSPSSLQKKNCQDSFSRLHELFKQLKDQAGTLSANEEALAGKNQEIERLKTERRQAMWDAEREERERIREGRTEAAECDGNCEVRGRSVSNSAKWGALGLGVLGAAAGGVLAKYAVDTNRNLGWATDPFVVAGATLPGVMYGIYGATYGGGSGMCDGPMGPNGMMMGGGMYPGMGGAFGMPMGPQMGGGLFMPGMGPWGMGGPWGLGGGGMGGWPMGGMGFAAGAAVGFMQGMGMAMPAMGGFPAMGGGMGFVPGMGMGMGMAIGGGIGFVQGMGFAMPAMGGFPAMGGGIGFVPGGGFAMGNMQGGMGMMNPMWSMQMQQMMLQQQMQQQQMWMQQQQAAQADYMNRMQLVGRLSQQMAQIQMQIQQISMGGMTGSTLPFPNTLPFPGGGWNGGNINGGNWGTGPVFPASTPPANPGPGPARGGGGRQ
jgi:hypothetical protein